MSEQDWVALAGLLIFLGLGFASIPFDRWLDWRREERDARERNQAHPWRKL